MANRNFMWVEDDVRDTLILKIVYQGDERQELYGIFEVLDVLETTGEQLDVITANIDDLTNLVSFGMVRFVNVVDKSDIIDIPLRNLSMLYQNGNVLGDMENNKKISFNELDAFAIIDGVVRNDLNIIPAIVNKPSDDLDSLMKNASKYHGYGMQEKFNALSEINLINHRRLMRDNNEYKLR